MDKAAVRSKAVVLLLLTCYLLLLGFCNSSMFCFTVLYVHSSFAIILMGKREHDTLLSLSYWYLVIVSGSSSRCHGFVCSLCFWYFLIILTYFFYEILSAKIFCEQVPDLLVWCSHSFLRLSNCNSVKPV